MDSMHKLQRVNRAIEDQKRYISRVPDPDNRCLAEVNLATLVELREKLKDQVEGDGADDGEPTGQSRYALLH